MRDVEYLGEHSGYEWEDSQGNWWGVDTHWVMLDGRAECVGLTVRSFALQGPEGKRRARPIRSGGDVVPVRATTLRELSLREVLDQARRAVVGFMTDLPRGALGLSSAERRRIEKTFAARPQIGRPPLTLEVLEEAAEAYRTGGRTPIRAVQEKQGLTYSAADSRVRAARKAGLLPPAARAGKGKR